MKSFAEATGDDPDRDVRRVAGIRGALLRAKAAAVGVDAPHEDAALAMLPGAP